MQGRFLRYNKKEMKRVCIAIFALLLWSRSVFAAPTVLVVPEKILQGDPARVTTEGTPFLKEVVFDGKSIPVFFYNGKVRAFMAIDLAKKPGIYELKATLTNGKIIAKTITIVGRKKPVIESVAIPESLGGNTSSSQKNLVAAISRADSDIKKAKTGSKLTWTRKFIPPLAEIKTTNPYGYGVDTGAYVLPHKGVDLKAKVGTNVMAMNRGVVKIARNYTAYGKMILIDHGLGLQTLYLHLSQMNVKEGDFVQRGQIIALTGDTGYVTGPHLHLSVKIGGISIDPIKFLNYFQ